MLCLIFHKQITVVGDFINLILTDLDFDLKQAGKQHRYINIEVKSSYQIKKRL